MACPPEGEPIDYDICVYFDEEKYLEKLYGFGHKGNQRINENGPPKSNIPAFSKEVFALFWKLEIQDLVVPEKSYEDKI